MFFFLMHAVESVALRHKIPQQDCFHPIFFAFFFLFFSSSPFFLISRLSPTRLLSMYHWALQFCSQLSHVAMVMHLISSLNNSEQHFLYDFSSWVLLAPEGSSFTHMQSTCILLFNSMNHKILYPLSSSHALSYSLPRPHHSRIFHISHISSTRIQHQSGIHRIITLGTQNIMVEIHKCCVLGPCCILECGIIQ